MKSGFSEMKFVLAFLLFLCCLFSYTQNFIDVKAGTSMNSGRSGPILESYEFDEHDVTDYPRILFNSSSKKTFVSPYVNLNYVYSRSKTFEWQLGLSYSQYKQDVMYYNQDPVTYYNGILPYKRTLWNATGKMNYNIFRFELAAVWKIDKIKFCLGFFNFDYALINIKNLSGTVTNYDVYPSHTQSSV